MLLTEACGWLAAVLVFMTFWSTTMSRLRAVAMASNVAFIAYGVMLGAPSIIALHGMLLPLNFWKLLRMRRLAALVSRASRGTMSLSMLVPFMDRRTFAAGETLLRRGDPADHVLYVISGAASRRGGRGDRPGRVGGRNGALRRRRQSYGIRRG